MNVKILIMFLLLTSCASIKKATVFVGEKIGNKKLVKASADMTPKQEYYLSRTLGAKIITQHRLLEDRKIQDYIFTLGFYLSQFSQRPETYKGYRFAVIKSQEPLAISTPDGTIFISHGLLKNLSDEDELAAILAHEISHVSLKHAGAAIKSANTIHLLGDLASKAINNGKSIENFDKITDVVLRRGFDRSQELEADAEAVRILRLAGFNPGALANLLAKMKDSTNFLSKHPSNEDRIKAVAVGSSATSGSIKRKIRFLQIVKN